MQNKAVTSEFTQSIAKEDIYAGFFTRLAAYLIDSLFLFACLAFPRFMFWIIGLSSPDNLLTKEILFSFSFWNIVEYLLCKAYFVILTYMSGMTLGKKAMRIKVITKDGERPSLFTVIYRETIGKYLSALVLYCGYLLVGIDKEKRGLHDILCDTRVVYSCKVVEYKQQQTVYTPVQPFVPTMPQGQNPVPPRNTNPVPPTPFYQAPPQNRMPVQPNPFYQAPPQNAAPFQNVTPAQSGNENLAPAEKANSAQPVHEEPVLSQPSQADVQKDNVAETKDTP